ncbi:MAG TPA: pyridoxal-dependent decarboxylase [Ignavibacteriaceae bacterium]|nr:pyridoxal-dependent decarboxylase [Ignavibacteriaceae bacterium]
MEANKNAQEMSPEEFRRYGYKMIDWIADYFQNIESHPVLPSINPGDIKKQLPDFPPSSPESMDDVISDIDKIIMPGITHWNHPDFMAYFNSTSSSPGILAELLCAAFNVNGMLWRTAPASAELERVTLNWLKKMIGIPDEFWGIIYDTASVSSLHGIAAAREQIHGLDIRGRGMAGRSDLPPLRLYCSEQAHSSIDKAAITLGVGLNGVRKIPVDKQFRMIPEKLREAIAEDRQNGWRPFCVVATVGTTSTTSIDPVMLIGEICNKENIWLHIDAAYGGTAAIVPEMKFILDGFELADSIVVNPHKWMFTPIDISAFYTRKPEVLKRAFSLVPEYLKTNENEEAENLMDYGIQLGRRFRSLKLWFVIRYFGVDGIIRILREHLRLAKLFAEWIEAHPKFERMAQVNFGVVCFRFHPADINNEDELNELNSRLVQVINETGKLFISHTKIDDKYIIRISISGLRTEEKHVKNAWILIRREAEKLVRKEE